MTIPTPNSGVGIANFNMMFKHPECYISNYNYQMLWTHNLRKFFCTLLSKNRESMLALPDEGAKRFALFCYSTTLQGVGGFADFNWFRLDGAKP